MSDSSDFEERLKAQILAMSPEQRAQTILDVVLQRNSVQEELAQLIQRTATCEDRFNEANDFAIHFKTLSDPTIVDTNSDEYEEAVSAR